MTEPGMVGRQTDRQTDTDGTFQMQPSNDRNDTMYNNTKLSCLNLYNSNWLIVKERLFS